MDLAKHLSTAIITRSEALKIGLKTYFTGTPCKYGHVCPRRADNWCCEECGRIKSAKRMRKWVPENKEQHADNQRRCHEKYKDRDNARSRNWYIANKEKCADLGREWRKNNRQKANELSANWRKMNVVKRRKICADWAAKNPEKIRVSVIARRARKAAAPGAFTPLDIENIFKSQKGRCAYCAVKLTRGYEVDHIVPLIRGGGNYPRNLQLVCSNADNSCNQRKGIKDPIVFAQSLGRLL